jgi:hypothetical protein
MVHDDADSPSVVRYRSVPLFIRQGAGEICERACALLESIGKSIGPFFHCFLIV